MTSHIPSVRHNILANLGGQAISALIGVLFIPIYVRVLGIEAYGLIGFFLSLQAFFTVFDVGLSATLNRELARQRYLGIHANRQRDMVRTLEWLYWPIGLLIVSLVWFTRYPLAINWLHPVSLGIERTADAIAVLGLAAGLQWPCGFYSGGFRGMERQITLNLLNAVFAALRYAGAAVILIFLSPTLEAFVWWQASVSALQTMAYAICLWRALPKGTVSAAFRPDLLREVGGFALSMSGITLASLLLSQSDRLILSTLLPLNEFGYYTLAATVAAALSTVVQPFFSALYPRFCGLVATSQFGRLSELYHQGTQLLAPIVFSAASVLAWFAKDVLLLWTQDIHIATESSPALTILVCGAALNGLLNLPYALQLAHGWTRLALYQTLISLAIVLPAIWWMGSQYGGRGAALVWLVLNLCYVTAGLVVMHRRLLPGQLSRWYLADALPPFLAAVVVSGALRLAFPSVPSGLRGVMTIGSIGVLTLSCAALASPSARVQLARLVLRN